MKKIVLISALLTSFLLSGCSDNNKPNGPVNNYFQKHSFKRTADEVEEHLKYDKKYFNPDMYEVSNIDEVREEYSYSNGKEEFTSYTSNTKFFTTRAEDEYYHPYIAKTDISYSHTQKKDNNKAVDEYTSNIVKWGASYGAIFSVETTKRDNQEEKKYNAVKKEQKDAFKEHYIDPVGEAYYDRDDNLCFYTEVIEKTTKEGINQQTYNYTHREQAIYIYTSEHRIRNYHYYDEVITNRDQETGKFFDKETIISYSYQEINYQYGNKKIENIDSLNKLVDGKKFVLDVKFTQYINGYRVVDGETYIIRDSATSEALRYDTEYDENGNLTYTTRIPCYDSPLYLGGTRDGLANRLETHVELANGAGALHTIGNRLTFRKYKELFDRYGIEIIENNAGDYFIFKKTFNNPPVLVVKMTVDTHDAIEVKVDLDIVP